MAFLRSANFFTGAAPGRLFQISTSRVVDQSAASFVRAASVPKLSALTTASASISVAWIVMLFVSFSMLKVIIFSLLNAASAAVMTVIALVENTCKRILRVTERN
jgi:hypothetical protein